MTDPVGTKERMMAEVTGGSMASGSILEKPEKHVDLEKIQSQFARPTAPVPDVLPGGCGVDKFGDCLPKNAFFGGYFRPVSSEADEGRLVFAPVPKRDGTFIPSGLVMMEHLILGSMV